MKITRLRSAITAFLLGVSLTLLQACGFTMRGQDLGLPFQAVAVEGAQGVANEMRQALASQPGLKLVSKPAESQVVLTVLTQNLERTVVAFSAAGRPREIQLRMRVRYKINDGYAVELSGPQEISQTRDLSINDAEILALGSAENFIIEDMQKDIAHQLLRRLRAVKLPQ